jgi:hypothetical protein
MGKDFVFGCCFDSINVAALIAISAKEDGMDN